MNYAVKGVLCIVAILQLPVFSAIDATGLFVTPSGLYRVSGQDGTTKQLINKTGTSAVFSPDGGKIAMARNGQLFIMYNDGTGSGDRAVYTGPCGPLKHFEWNTTGIFWCTRDTLFRFDPASKTATILRIFKNTVWEQSKEGSDYYSGIDGKNAFVNIPLFVDDGDRVHNHHAFMRFSDDFSTQEMNSLFLWGHGNVMSLDGRYFFPIPFYDNSPVYGFKSHTQFGVFTFDSIMNIQQEATSRYLYTKYPDSGWVYPDLAPWKQNADEILMPVNTHGVFRCYNNTDYFCFACSPKWNNPTEYRAYIVFNWRTLKCEEMPGPNGSKAAAGLFQGCWLGALPDTAGAAVSSAPSVSSRTPRTAVLGILPGDRSGTIRLTSNDAAIINVRILTMSGAVVGRGYAKGQVDVRLAGGKAGRQMYLAKGSVGNRPVCMRFVR